ncbi:MAG: sensor histidine kinase [Candidatus Binatia bacterium]
MSRRFVLLTGLFKPWQFPVIGGAIGFVYEITEHVLSSQQYGGSQALMHFYDFMEYMVPVTAGMLVGLMLNHIRKQASRNRSLSTQNVKLQHQFFTQALSSHILHEVRNPLHNLAAIIEARQQQPLAPEESAILKRNIDRLKVVTDQLGRWNAIDDSLTHQESVQLRIWFEELLTDKIYPQLQEANIALTKDVRPVVVHMHPLLLEQCFTTLFNNAIEAVGRGGPPRLISLSATVSSDRQGYVEIRIQNTGPPYPEAALTAQGREPIHSSYGLGLGLVLVRRVLEQFGGGLTLNNQDGRALTTLWIPGGKR